MRISFVANNNMHVCLYLWYWHRIKGKNQIYSMLKIVMAKNGQKNIRMFGATLCTYICDFRVNFDLTQNNEVRMEKLKRRKKAEMLSFAAPISHSDAAYGMR